MPYAAVNGLKLYYEVHGEAAQLCVVPYAGHGAMPKEVVLEFLEETSAGDPS